MPTELVAVMEPGQAEPPTDASDAWNRLRAENDELRMAVNQLGQQTFSFNKQFERDMLGAQSQIEMVKESVEASGVAASESAQATRISDLASTVTELDTVVKGRLE